MKTRPRMHAISIGDIICKAIIVMIILEGLGGPETQPITQVEGASRQSQRSTMADVNGGNLNRFETFGRSGDSGRMRGRCGRYSLLRVLQQWENLQKRCRLTLRNNFKKERSRYEYMSGSSPPSPSHIDEITIGKRTEGTLAPSTSSSINQHRNYYFEVNGDALESCCPVVFEVIAPIYGRNRSGHMAELYRDDNVQQTFYEYRCHKDYLERPCRYMDNQHRRISKCVQQYLDSYALVRSDTSLTGWSMEHIRVASGCACKVDLTNATRRRKKGPSSANHRRDGGLPFGSRNSKRGRTLQQQFRASIFDY